MGYGKLMSAIGEFDFYSSDYKVFGKAIGSLFDVNVMIEFQDWLFEEEFFEREPELMEFGKTQTYFMRVAYCRYDETKPSFRNTYLVYKVDIPVKLKHEKELTLEFVPNGIFQLQFLPFNSTWKFFIEDIFGVNDIYYSSHEDCVNGILEIRNCYIEILKKINCSQVLIFTDAGYLIESRYIYNISPNKIDRFKEILDTIGLIDKISLFNFMDALRQQPEVISEMRKVGSYFRIGFLDNLADDF